MKVLLTKDGYSRSNCNNAIADSQSASSYMYSRQLYGSVGCIYVFFVFFLFWNSCDVSVSCDMKRKEKFSEDVSQIFFPNDVVQSHILTSLALFADSETDRRIIHTNIDVML